MSLITGWDTTANPDGTTQVPTAYGKTYQLDIDGAPPVFVADGDSAAVVASTVDSLKAAIAKELRTARYLYLVYDSNYGTDAFTIMGLTDDELAGIDRVHLLEMGATDIVEHDYRVVEGSTDVTVTIDTDAQTITYAITMLDTFGVSTTWSETVSYA